MHKENVMSEKSQVEHGWVADITEKVTIPWDLLTIKTLGTIPKCDIKNKQISI